MRQDSIDTAPAEGDARGVRPVAIVLCCLVGACADEPKDPPPRVRAIETVVSGDGLSPPVDFEIPAGTRSLTVVIEGAPGALYALGAYTLADGVDQVALPGGPPGPAMQASYRDEQIGQMPGELFQSIRLGTFTHVYPYRPGQVAIEGVASLRVASDTPGPVTVHLIMPEDDGANVLRINFVVVSDTMAEPNTASFMAELERIYAQAGVSITTGAVERITGTQLEVITQSTEPQEAPGNQATMLTSLITEERPGLDVFFVESLPAGIGGLSLGTPGPPVRDSYYFGVVITGGLTDLTAARVTAHETAHFLALQHVRNRGVSGMTYDDPLDDTTPGTSNLMESGTALTPGQAFALTRSALLEPAP